MIPDYFTLDVMKISGVPRLLFVRDTKYFSWAYRYESTAAPYDVWQR